MGSKKLSSYSAFQYLIIGTIAASLYLIGVGIIFMFSGSLNIDDIKIIMSQEDNHKMLMLGYYFVIIGCFIKSAMFPMHSWLANVYQNAPIMVSAFLSSIASKIGIYIFIRFSYYLFDYKVVFSNPILQNSLIVVASLGIVFGAFTAVFQTNPRRLFAFSSISNMSYIILLLAMGSNDGLKTAIILIINHMMIKTTLFLIVGDYEHRLGRHIELQDIIGVAAQTPYLSAALTFSLLSLFGIPLTSGFIGKWCMIDTVIKYNTILLVPIIIGAVLSFFYVFKIIENIYFKGHNVSAEIKNNVSITMSVAIFLMCVLNVVLGFAMIFNYNIAEIISNSLTS
jgi:multicomponent Na+:H+ antiporter subunit D